MVDGMTMRGRDYIAEQEIQEALFPYYLLKICPMT
jgi:hypothetical protein